MAFTLDQLVLFAARSGNVAMIRDRVAAGGNPTQSGALLAAVFHGHASAVTALLQIGADPNATDAHGHGALEYAVRIGNPALARELIAYGARLAPHSRGHWREQLERLLSQSA